MGSRARPLVPGLCRATWQDVPAMTHRHERTLAAIGLARVEGEGAVHIRVRDDQVNEVRLDIYEPPRFF